MHSIHARTRRARRICELTQAQLASRIGVKRSAVAQWEATGGTSPTVEHLRHLAIVSRVNFEWLSTGRGPVNHSEEGADAAISKDFAQDETESLMLELLRRLPERKRRLACSIVQLLG